MSLEDVVDQLLLSHDRSSPAADTQPTNVVAPHAPPTVEELFAEYPGTVSGRVRDTAPPSQDNFLENMVEQLLQTSPAPTPSQGPYKVGVASLGRQPARGLPTSARVTSSAPRNNSVSAHRSQREGGGPPGRSTSRSLRRYPQTLFDGAEDPLLRRFSMWQERKEARRIQAVYDALVAEQESCPFAPRTHATDHTAATSAPVGESPPRHVGAPQRGGEDEVWGFDEYVQRVTAAREERERPQREEEERLARWRDPATLHRGPTVPEPFEIGHPSRRGAALHYRAVDSFASLAPMVREQLLFSPNMTAKLSRATASVQGQPQVTETRSPAPPTVPQSQFPPPSAPVYQASPMQEACPDEW